MTKRTREEKGKRISRASSPPVPGEERLGFWWMDQTRVKKEAAKAGFFALLAPISKAGPQ